mmetsp:Transcript_6671/g.17857  ORF Transcript_6671/g.17857 Transcript_6671/m.17857 type:complete len:244 (-) Transcript_6671:274-1005(-)
MIGGAGRVVAAAVGHDHHVCVAATVRCALRRKVMLAPPVFQRRPHHFSNTSHGGLSGQHMPVSRAASPEEHDGQRHRAAWHCKADGPAHRVLDVHDDCASNQRSHIDGQVEPVEKGLLLFAVLGVCFIKLVCAKGTDIGLNAASAQADHSQRSKEHAKLQRVGCVSILVGIRNHATGREHEDAQEVDGGENEDGFVAPPQGVRQQRANDRGGIAYAFKQSNQDGRKCRVTAHDLSNVGDQVCG